MASMHTAAARLTGRSSYLSEGLNPAVPVTIHLRGVDGVERDVQLSWKLSQHLLPVPQVQVPVAGTTTRHNAMAVSIPALRLTTAELNQMGARVPFFMTPQGRQALDGAHDVKPSAATFAKFGLTPEAADAINYFAVSYNLGGKHVLPTTRSEPADQDPT